MPFHRFHSFLFSNREISRPCQICVDAPAQRLRSAHCFRLRRRCPLRIPARCRKKRRSRPARPFTTTIARSATVIGWSVPARRSICAGSPLVIVRASTTPYATARTRCRPGKGRSATRKSIRSGNTFAPTPIRNRIHQRGLSFCFVCLRASGTPPQTARCPFARASAERQRRVLQRVSLGPPSRRRWPPHNATELTYLEAGSRSVFLRRRLRVKRLTARALGDLCTDTHIFAYYGGPLELQA